MKKMICILALLPLMACHHSKKAQDNSATTAVTNADGKMRFIVSFTSIGSGINREALKQFDAFIPQFESKNNVTLSPQKTRWGKEGEIDYCFKLDGLKPKLQDAFMAETKELLKNSDRVVYKENTPCRDAGQVIPKNPLPKE